MDKVQIGAQLSPYTYQQLQKYMTEQGLDEATAIETILSRYFAGQPQDELTTKIAQVEQHLSDIKRHIIALRFRKQLSTSSTSVAQ